MNTVSSYDKGYFKFVGEHCNGCKVIVDEQVGDLKGIIKIEINCITNIVMIEFDTALITIKKIQERLINSRCKFINIGPKS